MTTTIGKWCVAFVLNASLDKVYCKVVFAISLRSKSQFPVRNQMPQILSAIEILRDGSGEEEK